MQTTSVLSSSSTHSDILVEIDTKQTLKQENNELMLKLQTSEQQRIVGEKKIQALQAELERSVKERHGLVITIENQRTERLTLIQTAENLKNQHTLHDAENHKYESLSKTLKEQNEALKQELQTIKLEKVALLKEKQNASNKLLLAESKLEAISMQEAYANAAMTQFLNENQRLKEEVDSLNKKLKELSGGYVKTILKDNNQTTKQLLSEFEEKIHCKEMANLEETKRYEAKIAQLNLKVAQLESQLASK